MSQIYILLHHNFKLRRLFAMSPKLYAYDMSTCSVAVYFTQAALGLKIERVNINLWRREQFCPEFLSINPRHTVPTFVDDDGTVICDSHVINTYLCSKYGKNDSLYPKDHKRRALVDQLMYFDASQVFPQVKKLIMSVGNNITPSEEDVRNVQKLCGYMEGYLNGRKWLAGDEITLADFSLIPNIVGMITIVPIDFQKYPNVNRWLSNAKQLPFYHEQARLLNLYHEFRKERQVQKSSM